MFCYEGECSCSKNDLFGSNKKKETDLFFNNFQYKGYVNILEIMNEEIRKVIYKISELSSYTNNS